MERERSQGISPSLLEGIPRDLSLLHSSLRRYGINLGDIVGTQYDRLLYGPRFIEFVLDRCEREGQPPPGGIQDLRPLSEDIFKGLQRWRLTEAEGNYGRGDIRTKDKRALVAQAFEKHGQEYSIQVASGLRTMLDEIGIGIMAEDVIAALGVWLDDTGQNQIGGVAS